MASTYLVYVTAGSDTEARKIAKTVVEERLAACANLLGGIQSVYWWNGSVCTDNETALILKTTKARKNELILRILQLHSYDVPCVCCLPIMDGNPGFLSWIGQETCGADR